MGVADVRRVKREEYSFLNQHPTFSNWEILIEPADWENGSMGEDGMKRYKIYDLQTSWSGPGLYELGISLSPTGVDCNAPHLNPSCIITVYLGQTDNIRRRLQHYYGHGGSHLDHCKSSKGGKRFFADVFLRGFPIVFRWMPVERKKKAEKVEACMLRVFDYAWNKHKNDARRLDDILQILDKITSGTTEFYNGLYESQCHHQSKNDVRVNTNKPPKLFKTASRHPKLRPDPKVSNSSQIWPQKISKDRLIDKNAKICPCCGRKSQVCAKCGKLKGKVSVKLQINSGIFL